MDLEPIPDPGLFFRFQIPFSFTIFDMTERILFFFLFSTISCGIFWNKRNPIQFSVYLNNYDHTLSLFSSKPLNAAPTTQSTKHSTNTALHCIKSLWSMVMVTDGPGLPKIKTPLSWCLHRPSFPSLAYCTYCTVRSAVSTYSTYCQITDPGTKRLCEKNHPTLFLLYLLQINI